MGAPDGLALSSWLAPAGGPAGWPAGWPAGAGWLAADAGYTGWLVGCSMLYFHY